MFGLDSVSSYNPKDDPLSSGPPKPSSIPSAKKSSGSGKSKPDASDGDGGTRALSLMGGSPQLIAANAMMTIEQNIKALQRAGFPQVAQLFQLAVEQGRDMLASALANQAQGGTGVLTQDAGAPPPNPMMPSGGAAPPAPGPGPAMGGMGMMMPPPPQ